MEMLSKNQKIIGVAGIAVVCIVIIIYYINATKSIYGYNEIVVSENEEEKIKEVKEEETNNIVVHITGAVKKQGIVYVKEDARINDVIEAAGEVIDEANLSDVNLAYVVEDGQKIYIPFEREGENELEDDGEIISDNAGENVIKRQDKEGNSGRININTASTEKLTELPGIRSFHST